MNQLFGSSFPAHPSHDHMNETRGMLGMSDKFENEG